MSIALVDVRKSGCGRGLVPDSADAEAPLATPVEEKPLELPCAPPLPPPPN